MAFTHLIWDFNGTILDDVEIGIESANVLLKDCDVPLISSVDFYRSVFGFPIRDYYERLGIDFNKTPFESLAPVWVREYLSRVGRAPLNSGVLSTLDRVREKGIPQILLSATEIDMLRGQLSDLGLTSCFDDVLGLDNIHAADKTALAKMWLAEHPNAKPLFFGDTDHDFAVAKAAGCECVLFSGGHQARERLLGLGCPVVGEISEIVNYLT